MRHQGGEKLTHKLKKELFGGWTTFEASYIIAFLLLQIVVFIYEPGNWLSFISGFTGILCVTFVAKGKISNYAFGLVQVVTYIILSWQARLYGEVSLNLIIYLPVQFIGFYMWHKNMMKEKVANKPQSEEIEVVEAKGLSLKQYIITMAVIVIGWLLYALLLDRIGSHQPYLDALTVALSVTAQILMLLRFKEQWTLWIIVNVLSIILWVRVVLQQGSTDYGLIVMYLAYLGNSIYGLINWARLQRKTEQLQGKAVYL
ncbi:nicotinamide riboside transporter PnuC [Sporolactobacillus sp. THM7-4]|nr:nicotinamide riboside transporter PnuC [Sporolactobacillus sp. THM7-4]